MGLPERGMPWRWSGMGPVPLIIVMLIYDGLCYEVIGAQRGAEDRRTIIPRATGTYSMMKCKL